MELKAGMTFGKLTIIENRGFNHCLCKCECGREVYFTPRLLTQRYVTACTFCDRKPIVKKHGDSRTRLYTIWVSMRQRCKNQNAPEYHRYGGRGITVCKEWDESYESFRDWAKSNGYNDTLTIDRIDNDKGYSPDNCQWLTKSENSKKRGKSAERKG